MAKSQQMVAMEKFSSSVVRYMVIVVNIFSHKGRGGGHGQDNWHIPYDSCDQMMEPFS